MQQQPFDSQPMVPKTYPGEKKASLTNGAMQIRYPHVEDWS
jgi:hypothetical protein